jgi:hypothetical protein
MISSQAVLQEANTRGRPFISCLGLICGGCVCSLGDFDFALGGGDHCVVCCGCGCDSPGDAFFPLLQGDCYQLLLQPWQQKWRR